MLLGIYPILLVGLLLSDKALYYDKNGGLNPPPTTFF